MNEKGISIIIVSWNTKDITDKCLVSMKKAVEFVKGKYDVEVIVVENDSEDGTPEMIAKKHPWAKLIPSGSDLGYAKGNNFGFKRANPKNKYILLLNNDAFVQKDTLAKSMEYFEKNEECGVLGCQLRYEDGRFQPSAGHLPEPLSSWAWMWGLDKLPILKNFAKPVHPKDRSYFKKDRKSGWVMGAFLFMKREVFEKTKGFDENFFMYMEEVEWCRRVWQKGYEIWYTPKFWITHVDKASAFGDPKELAKIFRKEIMGLAYYMRKHYPSQVWWLIPFIRIGVLVRLVVFTLMGNKMRQEAYLRTFKEL
jgi:GT2 family glycosyltransferase